MISRSILQQTVAHTAAYHDSCEHRQTRGSKERPGELVKYDVHIGIVGVAKQEEYARERSVRFLSDSVGSDPYILAVKAVGTTSELVNFGRVRSDKSTHKD